MMDRAEFHSAAVAMAVCESRWGEDTRARGSCFR